VGSGRQQQQEYGHDTGPSFLHAGLAIRFHIDFDRSRTQKQRSKIITTSTVVDTRASVNYPLMSMARISMG
jgi:hypothetical protein